VISLVNAWTPKIRLVEMGAYYDEIEIEDMTWDDLKKVYHYPCPCGDRFEISKAQLANYEDIATCPSCSLIIRVIYDPVSLFIFTLPRSSLTARPTSLITRTIPRTTKAVPLSGSILLEVRRVIKMAARGKWTLNLVKLYKHASAWNFVLVVKTALAGSSARSLLLLGRRCLVQVDVS